ncbi:MAG: FHA domain-containing protein [Woeseiaceae bacterium]
MANDNKKIHGPASESDEDTSELEILPETIAADPDYDYESEADAATHAFESLNRKQVDPSIAAFQSTLRERDETINRLQFDIEQLRARRSGLETELKAREELTTNVTTELTRANHRLNEAQERLKRAEAAIAAHEATIGQQEERLGDATRMLAEARAEVENRQAEVDNLGIRNSEAMDRIDSLIGDLNHEKSEHKRVQAAEQALAKTFGELEVRHSEFQSLVESLRHYIEGRKERWEQQQAALLRKDELLENQRKKIGEFARDIKHDTKRLRKEQAARQNLQTQNEILQKDNQQLQGELAELKTLLAAAEASVRETEQQTALLTNRLDETVRALEEEQFERRSVASELREREDEVSSLRAEISRLTEVVHGSETLSGRQQQEIEALTRQLAQTSERLGSQESRRRDLESQLASLQGEAAQLRQHHRALEDAAAGYEKALSQQLAEIDRLTTQLRDTTQKLENEQTDRQNLASQHAALQEQAQQLHAQIETLKVAAAYKASLKKEHAELSGLVASNEATIKELKLRVSKNEAYADTLRTKMQQQLADSEALAAAQRSTGASLQSALERVDRLTLQLEDERNSNAELAEAQRHNQAAFEDEIRKIRFELDEAQETIAETHTVNEKLTSDLADNSGFRQQLESQLIESDEDRKKEVNELNSQLAKSKQRVEEFERKVANKDAAINALLTELAHKPHIVPSEHDNVVHTLVNKKSHAADDKAGPDKDRVTRLLIGNIDGQELRFPLFKDKLTIGRTAHNDIQLKAQYISRRHAVVVTDDECTRIVDWGSKNGIYVNGTRVTEKILKNGDMITVGTAHFKFEERHKR